MAARKNTAPKARPAPSDLPAILARFSDARCVLECGVRCLEERGDRAASDEAVCLRHGLSLLAGIYDEFDLAISKARA